MDKQVIHRLHQAALQARDHSYSPYSHFAVGAALLGANGTIYTGCNVENASYGLAICAERNAITHAVATGAKQFAAIAIVGGVGQDTARPCLPCGMCLQVMAEFCSPDFEVYVFDHGTPTCYHLSDLLPHNFKL